MLANLARPAKPKRPAWPALSPPRMNTTRPPHLTPADVARQLGVHVSNVYRWMQAGRLACQRIGTRYRTTQADVDAFLAACAAAGDSPPPADVPPTPAQEHADAVEDLAAAGLIYRTT